VFFRIPDDKKLEIGRHRIRMVVAGDGTGADQFIEVLPKGAPVFVSDVDGTLTEKKGPDLAVVCDEEADPAALVESLAGGSNQPNVHVGAPELYTKLVGLGYRVMYLTARPEWLEPHTHKFLRERNRGDGRGDLPEGLVHTTLGEFGALPKAAQVFKHDELQMLRDKGLNIVLGFGDQGSDVAAYSSAQIPYGFYYEKEDTALRTCSDITGLPLAPTSGLQKGNWRHLGYTKLLPVFEPLVAACSQ
jgi:phosphatidate phosphatase PAH1